jgi:hypothetical protein
MKKSITITVGDNGNIIIGTNMNEFEVIGVLDLVKTQYRMNTLCKPKSKKKS